MKKKNTLSKVKTRKKDQITPIAIVGMAGILPNAENLSQYWDNILNEVNCIREVPSSRWNVDEYFDPDPSTPDKSYSKYGGFIPDIDFDPIEFGLPPNLMEVTDVSQLLSLLVTKDALTNAGYLNANESILDRTGVILGMVGMSSNIIQPLLNRLQYPIWEKVLKSSGVNNTDVQKIIEKMKLAYISWNENAFPGAIGNVIAGRIANRFNLGGTNCVIDAACASSLSAVKMAVSELVEGHADMMITGGVDTDNSILTYMCFSKTPAFSKGAHSKPFDAGSDGMLAGEGIGMMVLKRLADAEADNDRIFAVIKGIGSSSDGRSKSIYAPSSGGQAKALRRAYERANISPSSVRLIEAHGTGTNAGDAAEFSGLQEVFGEEPSVKQQIALGSIKSQIGHTKATAGAAGLIKASLALYHKILPATINVSDPNPDFDIKNSAFYLNSENRPWFKNASIPSRTAGVSSFGFGGTNFHIVLEEYSQDQGIDLRLHSTPYSVVISAQSNEQLKKNCQESLKKLEGPDGIRFLDHIDQETSNIQISDEFARIGFVAATLQDACEKMQICVKLISDNHDQNAWTHPQGIYYRRTSVDPKGKTVALFPGQGAQYINMGKNLALNFPLIRQTFENANEVFSSDGREPLTDCIFPIPVFTEDEKNSQKESLTNTKNAQPAIGTLSIGLYKLLAHTGFQADFFAGHSFGELTALWASGVFDEETLIRLAKARGEAMALPVSSAQDTGTMIAVKGNIELITELVTDNSNVSIANLNSPSQVVLAGSTQAISSIKPDLEKLGLKVFSLHVSAAFHTPFVGHAQAPFKMAIEKENFKIPTGKVFSNSTAQEYEKDPHKIANMLTEHILNPVRFKEEIENIYEQGGTIFIEIGPKNILTNLVKDILKGKPHETISLNPNAKNDSDLQFRQAIVQMRVIGFQLSNSDPYKNHQIPEKSVHSKVSVKLNGGLYTTDKTRSKFEQALLEKPFINSTSNSEQGESGSSSSQENSAKHKQLQNAPNNLSLKKETTSPLNTEILNNSSGQLHKLFEKMQDHQTKITEVHQQFLQNDKVTKDLLGEIIQNEISILSNYNDQQQNADQALSDLSKKADFVNTQHNGTAKAHLEYINSQSSFSQQYTTLISSLVGEEQNNFFDSYDQIIDEAIDKTEKPRLETSISILEKPVAVHPNNQNEIAHSIANQPAARSISVEDLTLSFLQIVSEKTGYPTEMLELEMDMEADLGIDSIKRVEILGAIQEQYPQLPSISAEELAVLRTLDQIIQAFNATPSPNEHAPQVSLISTNSNETQPLSLAQDDIQTAFLQVVSEKTGYPTDMLELGMDMEADLGIDSIKRVEILGAIQEQYPQLPVIAVEDLAVLRTLEQIIGTFNSNPESPLRIDSEQKEPDSSISSKIIINKQSSNLEIPDIQPAFLEIVSEKTGYPTDMLEMGMDLEADLGIDSIKRVEILGAMQERFPQLPVIEAEDLAILNTLEQIIAKFSVKENNIKPDNTAAPIGNVEKTILHHQQSVERFPVEVQQLAQPDYMEFTLPKENLILITDDGTSRSQSLVDSFLEKGHQVGLIHFDSKGNCETENIENGLIHYYITNPTEKVIQSLMENIVEEWTKISAFIHVHPSGGKDQKELLQVTETQSDILKAVFLIARQLKKPLISASAGNRSAFLTITQVDGQFGLNGNGSNNPMPGGFSGLAKTLRMEWNTVFCRALDIHPDIDSEKVVNIINAELHDPNLLLAEVGYCEKGRYTLALGKKELVVEAS
jgi:acyl transferase domain-containing protein